jgi:hypothetical protein
MPKSPNKGSKVYAWEKEVYVFDLYNWQETVFDPLCTALRDTHSSYAKVDAPNKKTCNVTAPDGSSWWITKVLGRPGVSSVSRLLSFPALSPSSTFVVYTQEIHYSSSVSKRFFSISGVIKFMETEEGKECGLVQSGVCVYTVIGSIDEDGALPVRSASGTEHTLEPKLWYKTAQNADNQNSDDSSSDEDDAKRGESTDKADVMEVEAQAEVEETNTLVCLTHSPIVSMLPA